ncbi:hypothetical protein LAV60_09570 [Clostridium sporogenes]|uniref:hypothetical protein n=1 Tax=Clostridium sporogenes TaxID=1509 RepID=UPI002238FD17|nr:hypothetical protein [Clostridium sporogenes]MCW6093420.1 hypothetical protein [Clostridium sporogenes]
MIIWINGSFGIGKTTISNELNKKIINSFIYDPEMAGDLFGIIPPIVLAEKETFKIYHCGVILTIRC